MPMQSENQRIINFGAGPAKLPPSVIDQLQTDLSNLEGSGLSILEISHRSAEFDTILKGADAKMRALVGEDQMKEFKVLFMQGGGTLQFSAVPMNLAGPPEQAGRLVYLVTGHWSRQAALEAINLGYSVEMIEIVTKSEDKHVIVDLAELKASIQENPPKLLYYCDNETIDGIEMPSSDHVGQVLDIDPVKTIMVTDMSSNFLSRPIDLSRTGLVFASAQKNIGPAGIAVVVIRESLLSKYDHHLPKMMDYRLFAKNNSLYNTPPTFTIHAIDLVLGWILSEFGTLEKVDEFSRAKASILYKAIDGKSDLIKNVPVDFRSRMNVIWKYDDGKKDSEFLKKAESQGMIQLKGHRSVGGLRASLYNAVTLDEVQELASLINKI